MVLKRSVSIIGRIKKGGEIAYDSTFNALYYGLDIKAPILSDERLNKRRGFVKDVRAAFGLAQNAGMDYMMAGENILY